MPLAGAAYWSVNRIASMMCDIPRPRGHSHNQALHGSNK